MRMRVYATVRRRR